MASKDRADSSKANSEALEPGQSEETATTEKKASSTNDTKVRDKDAEDTVVSPSNAPIATGKDPKKAKKVRKAVETTREDKEKQKEYRAVCTPPWARQAEDEAKDRDGSGEKDYSEKHSEENNGDNSNEDEWEDEDENEDEDEDEDDEEHEKPCICGKPVSKVRSGHQFFFSQKAIELAEDWTTQLAKRNQDFFHMHIYNDWNVWGIIEVRENQLLAINRELKKKKPDPSKLWCLIESIALFFEDSPDWDWDWAEDQEKMQSFSTIFGVALICTINVLISNNLFKKDSSVKNLSLVINYWLHFAEAHVRYRHEWKGPVIGLGTQYEVLEPLPGCEKLLERTIEDVEELLMESYSSDALNPDWKGFFNEYFKHYACDEVVEGWYTDAELRNLKQVIGGDRYDITKMSKKERLKHSYL